MAYDFQSRLNHTSKRMSQLNQACGTYIRGTQRIPITLSPILISADELSPGGAPSLLRVERQDFGIWRCSRGPNNEYGLGTLYPPQAGDKIEFNDQTFNISSMGSDEPPYTNVTTNRERLIVHTVQVG